jgi:predicted amidohydrolase YtcJ
MLHHRVEHVGFLSDPRDIERMQKLGMRLTITRATRPAGGGRGRRGPAFAALVRAGLEPMVVSDATGTSPGFSPLNGIAALVGIGTGSDAVSFDDALRMWTLWAARGQLEGRDKGSIEVGKLGDFAVLSADPRGRSADQLADLRVDATILGGEVTFGA